MKKSDYSWCSCHAEICSLFTVERQIKWGKTLPSNIPDQGLIFILNEECPQIDKNEDPGLKSEKSLREKKRHMKQEKTLNFTPDEKCKGNCVVISFFAPDIGTDLKA